MIRRVALVRTDGSEERSTSFISVTRIGELGTTLSVTSIVPSSPILVTQDEGGDKFLRKFEITACRKSKDMTFILLKFTEISQLL
jgi:hypothetical protein